MRTRFGKQRASAVAVAVVAVVAVAVAAATALAASNVKTSSVTIQPRNPNPTFGKTQGRCPKGNRPAALGLSMPTANTVVQPDRMQLAGRSTAAAAYSYSTKKSKLTALAYCSKPEALNARTKTVKLANGATTSATAKCKSSERLAFGGFRVTGNRTAIDLSSARKSGARGWKVSAFAFETGAKLTTTAYCSKDAPRTTSESKTTPVAGAQAASLEAKCPKGSHARFGGFKSKVTASKAFVLLRSLKRGSTRSWQASARNDNQTSPGSLTAYSYCD